MSPIERILPDPRIRCPLELLVFIVCTGLLFRPLNRSVLRARMPFFLDVVCVWFLFSLLDSVWSFQACLQQLLGHEVFDPYRSARDFDLAWAVVTVVGMPFAIWNLVSGRAKILNLLALAAAVVCISFFVLGSMRLFVWYL